MHDTKQCGEREREREREGWRERREREREKERDFITVPYTYLPPWE